MKQLLDECLTELGLALKRFGTYSFDDKGAEEVMDVEVLAEKFRKMSVEDASTVLLALAKSKKHGGRGESLVASILNELAEWDELLDLPEIEELDW